MTQLLIPELCMSGYKLLIEYSYYCVKHDHYKLLIFFYVNNGVLELYSSLDIHQIVNN